jgi:hypothetical protein
MCCSTESTGKARPFDWSHLWEGGSQVKANFPHQHARLRASPLGRGSCLKMGSAVPRRLMDIGRRVKNGSKLHPPKKWEPTMAVSDLSCKPLLIQRLAPREAPVGVSPASP